MLLAVCVGCQGRSAPAAPPGGGAPARAPTGPTKVFVARPRPEPFVKTVVANGRVAPRDSLTLSAMVEGAIVDVRADLGDRVPRGGTLARIAAEDYRARIARNDAELAQARADVSRLEGLVASNLATGQALEQARTRVAVAVADRALLQRQLRDTTIRAPFDVAVTARHVALGAFVRLGNPLFDVIAADALEVVVDVPEADAEHLVVGAEFDVAPREGSAASVRARIARVAPAIQVETRSLRVEGVLVGEAPASLRPGAFVLARFAGRRIDDAVRLPRGAIISMLGVDRAFVVRDGAARSVDVELLGEQASDAIVRGLPADADVVVRGVAALSNGLRVQAVPADSAPGSER